MVLASLSDLSSGTLVAGFVASTVGFSVFLYGKKQQRVPQLVGGLGLMVVPMTGLGALAVSLISIAIVGGVFGAVRMGL